MADMPPPIVGSSAQAGYVQGEASRVRDAERSGQSGAAEKSIKAIDQAGNAIETSDEDTAVFSDSEGGGTHGRDAGDGDQEEIYEDDGEALTGVVIDDEGAEHLDIQA